MFIEMLNSMDLREPIYGRETIGCFSKGANRLGGRTASGSDRIKRDLNGRYRIKVQLRWMIPSLPLRVLTRRSYRRVIAAYDATDQVIDFSRI